jgi:SprT protein
MEKHIEKVVKETLLNAGNIFNRTFYMIPSRCDIKGKVAGYYCFKNGQKYLRFNPSIYKENKDTYDDVIVHEVAHYVTHELYPGSKPHGKEWKGVMRSLGKEPERCHAYKVTPARKLKTFKYKCDCMEYELTSIRHNKILKGHYYTCQKCKSRLVKG